MKILKRLLMVLGTLPILALLAIGIIVFDLSVVNPKRHEGAERKIAAWNAEHWQTGEAMKVTAQVSGPAAPHEDQDSVSILCLKKQFRSGRNAYTRSVSMPKGGYRNLTVLTAPFADHTTLRFEMRNLCDLVATTTTGLSFPQPVKPSGIKSEVIVDGYTFKGSLSSESFDSLLNEIQPEIVMVEALPIRDLMDKKTYLSMR